MPIHSNICDVSACLYCANVLEFIDASTTKAVTTEEINNWPTETKEEILRVQAAIQKRNKLLCIKCLNKFLVLFPESQYQAVLLFPLLLIMGIKY